MYKACVLPRTATWLFLFASAASGLTAFVSISRVTFFDYGRKRQRGQRHYVEIKNKPFADSVVRVYVTQKRDTLRVERALSTLMSRQKWYSHDHFMAMLQSWKTSPEAVSLGIRQHGQNRFSQPPAREIVCGQVRDKPRKLTVAAFTCLLCDGQFSWNATHLITDVIEDPEQVEVVVTAHGKKQCPPLL